MIQKYQIVFCVGDRQQVTVNAESIDDAINTAKKQLRLKFGVVVLEGPVDEDGPIYTTEISVSVM